MTQKLVGKHYMYSSLLLLLDKGETIISKEKKKRLMSLLYLVTWIFHILRH